MNSVSFGYRLSLSSVLLWTAHVLMTTPPAFSGLAHGQSLPRHCAVYRETTGAHHDTFSWELVEGEEWMLTTRGAGETFRTHLTPQRLTIRWEIESPQQRSGVSARRDGSSLIIRGTVDGKLLERNFELGDLPWLQSLSASLPRFLPQCDGPREFWILRPDNLELHRMQVANIQEETLLFGGEKVATWRVEVRPAGFWAAIWKGDYWFRRSDRRFLRYRGASGPPGSAETEITLLAEGEGPARSAVPVPD